MQSCAFTGHRPSKLPYLDRPGSIPFRRLADALCRACLERMGEGVTQFITGMALGVDMLAGEVVLSLREKHPEISLVCALPCRDQAERWGEGNRRRYSALLQQANEVVVLQESYSSHAFLARDRYMVERCDCLIAVFDGSPGGTRYTVDCARKAGKPVLRIDPHTFAFQREEEQLRFPL